MRTRSLFNTKVTRRNRPGGLAMLMAIILLMIAGLVGAQDERAVRALKAEADEYYEGEQYHLATERYREIANLKAGNADVIYRLAECYRRTFNYPEAEAYYLKTHFLAPSQYPLSLYYYALMLKLNGSFDESMQYFTEFIDLHQDRDAKDFVEQAIIDRSGCQSAKEAFSAEGNAYPLIALPLNSKFNDFAPAVRDSLNLVITSSRILSNRQSIDERFGEAFTDNYYYQKVGSVWTDKTKQFFSATNSRFNDGSGCFNNRGDKYYLTVCGVGGPTCRVYVSEWKDNRWNEPLLLNENVNFKEFESRQPAISRGGDSLVFASNRPGGAGGFDLWLCVNSGGDNWGPAMNLGTHYNTKLNELSPSFTTFPNVLFFASDGHEGLGGLDLYMAKRLSTGETVLYNLGLPFNSNRDDAFLALEEHTVYWSSNRLEGLGGFDVQAVKIPSTASFVSRMSQKNRNARRDIMLKKRVETAETASLQASRIDERIDYDQLSSEKQRLVDLLVEQYVASKKPRASEYGLSTTDFDQLERVARLRYAQMLSGSSGYQPVSVPATDGIQSILTVTVADSTTQAPLADVRVILMDQYGQLLKITHANDEGKVRFTGVGAGAYLLRADRSLPSQRYAKLSDVSITQPEINSALRLDNIYFDFDHYKLRPEARRTLDQLADYLLRTPGAQLELFAFADDVGTTEYNLKLSQKRGESVASYLRLKGVDQTSIAIVAKGKQMAREIDVEWQRQYNRRVEFNLNGSVGDFKEVARTGILRQATDLKSLAQQAGVTQDVIQDLNGIAGDDQLKANQPVRLPAESAARTKGVVIY
ncbi:MAG TPA: OmpA family protein [Chryseolinea sp.]|nr:OmpA family protein [Chryseolinea sp.]